MRRLLACALLLSAVEPLAAQGTGPVLTLEEAVRLAIQNNPGYLQTTTQRARAGAALRSAYGDLLPTVNTSFGSSYREGRPEIVAGQQFGAASDLMSSSASVNLFGSLNGQAWMANRVGKANLDAAEADVTSSAAQLRSTVISQYLSVLQAQARAAFAETLLVNTQAQLTLAQARQQVGAANIVDVRRAEVAVGQQRVAVLRERNTAEVEKLRLFQQIGIDQPADVQLTSRFTVEEPRVQLGEVINLARQANPALTALRSREQAAHVGVSSARSSYLPTLSYSTGISGNSQQLTDIGDVIESSRAGAIAQQRNCLTTDSLRRGAGLPGIAPQCAAISYTADDEARQRAENAKFPFSLSRNPLNFSVQLSLPIFDGFQREQRVQEASAARNDARYRVREQELRLTADVTSAYRNLVTAFQTVGLQEQTSVAAREALALAQERFRVGANTFVDVTQARSDYERAETDRINAIYEYHKAFAALEAAVGRPLR
ncbi:MAG: TolC family protein [Gemmatimonadota bacterium]